jgi:hypothetical protein
MMGIESSQPTKGIQVINNPLVSGGVCLKLGNSYIFVSGGTGTGAAGILCISGGIPTSNADAAKVGAQ